MKRPKLRWVEIVGLLPSSLLLGPLIAYGLLGMIFVLAQWATRASQGIGLAAIRALFPLLLLMVSALAGLVATWSALLLGAERLRGKWWQRGCALCGMLAGMGASVSWLAWMGRQSHGKFDATTWVVWSLLLAPPLVVGAHQVYLLIRPGPRAMAAPDEGAA